MFKVAIGVVRLLDGLVFNAFSTMTELSKFLKERRTFLEQGLPVSPPGYSPGQTVRIYSLLTYLKMLEPHREDGHEEAKDKWRAARAFRAQGNNPATSGGPVAALEQFSEAYLLAASAMARQGLPVSVGTDVFSHTSDFIASFRMSDRDQQQALAELILRQMYQPTSILDKHIPDAVWDALVPLRSTFPPAGLGRRAATRPLRSTTVARRATMLHNVLATSTAATSASRSTTSPPSAPPRPQRPPSSKGPGNGGAPL